jgi:hypothetical protein
MYPRSRPRISWLLGRIIVGSIWWRIHELCWHLIHTTLDLLHEYDIRIIGRDEIRELSLVMSRTDTVYIPGDDAHRLIIYDKYRYS